MVALIKGAKAPSVDLEGIDGQRYNLSLAISSTGLVVLAFFKVSCPTCQYTLPFLERLHQRHQSRNIWGISQDDLSASQAFAREYNLTLPILLDAGLSATVNYDLTIVPSIFLLNKDLSIEQTIVGFDRDQMEQLNARLAEASRPVTALFSVSDNAPPAKPG
jgi:peroxiredoxin